MVFYLATDPALGFTSTTKTRGTGINGLESTVAGKEALAIGRY